MNRIDPSGSISLGSVSTAIGSGLRIASFGIRIGSAAIRGAQAIDTAVSFYQFFFGGGLQQVRQAAEHAFRQWGKIPPSSGTSLLLKEDFWQDALTVLSQNSAKIAARITAQHGDSIVSRFATRARKPFTWAVFMPTPDDGRRNPIDRLIPNPRFRIPFPGLRIAGVPVVLQFGGGGGKNLGRLFGLGVASVRQGVPTNQFFRMDYHIPHGRGSNDAYYWESQGSNHRFHFVIPE